MNNLDSIVFKFVFIRATRHAPRATKRSSS
jgi:hypothetical protein